MLEAGPVLAVYGMNLILLFASDFVPGTGRVVLSGRRCQHIKQVLRAKVGDGLRVGLLNRQVGKGRVVAIFDQRLELAVNLTQAPPPPPSTTLILGLPRPKSLRRVIQAASALGVKRIVLLGTWRVEKSYWHSPALSAATLREQMVLGLEQAGDTRLPELIQRPRFRPFVEDELPGLIENSRRLVAHPGTGRLCPSHLISPVTLAVGPEGGFIPFEVEKLKALGFEPVHLGRRLLRVDQAVPAFLGRLL